MTITLNGTSGVTTPALASTGTLTAASFNAASTFGFKNRLINGNISTDQRNAGASQTFTAGAALAYCVDRWYGYCTGANVTGQQIAGAYTSSQYRYQFTGAASVTAIGFGQRIEAKNSFDLANTTATLSCYISNSLLTTVTWTAYYANSTDTFGTLASPTRTQISTGTFTVSSTRTQYTTSISIPSAATTGIEIVFTVGAQTSGTWIIDSIQLEPGSTATTFDYRPYGTELALCQRYYWQANMSNATVNYWMTCMSTSPLTSNNMQIPLTTSLRTSPQFVLYPAYNTGWNLNNAIVNQTFSGVPTILGYSASSVAVNIQTSGVMNAGYPNYLYNATGQAGYIALNAEL